MKNYYIAFLALVLGACNGTGDPLSSTEHLGTSTTASPSLPTPIASVTPVPTPTPTPKPCQDKAIPIGTGNSTYSVFIVATSPSSNDQLFLNRDCEWWANWGDKTWNGGGTAYNTSGTYVFSGNTITFQPSGLSYTIAEIAYRTNDPAYGLSLNNPGLLSTYWTGQNIADHEVHTGLAFQDWLINTDLQNGVCNSSQNSFNSCMNNNYTLLNLSGKRSILYRD